MRHLLHPFTDIFHYKYIGDEIFGNDLVGRLVKYRIKSPHYQENQ